MIDEYLRIFCLSIIDDLNEKHKDISSRSEELKKLSSDYSETDFVFRIGYFFRERVTFERKESKKESQGALRGHIDIQVPSKDFKIEVKFAKSHKSKDGRNNNKLPWGQMVSDFSWLKYGILHNEKYKRAFVVGWFNTDEFNKLIQIGASEGGHSGGYPKVDPNKDFFFPFIGFDVTRRTDSVKIDYEKMGKPLPVEIPDFRGVMNCLFLGRKEDIFHIAIYY